MCNQLKYLKKGNVIANPANWKKYQNLVNLILAVLGVVAVVFPGLNITTAQVLSIAGFYNAYVTTITTDKVGI